MTTRKRSLDNQQTGKSKRAFTSESIAAVTDNPHNVLMENSRCHDDLVSATTSVRDVTSRHDCAASHTAQNVLSNMDNGSSELLDNHTARVTRITATSMESATATAAVLAPEIAVHVSSDTHATSSSTLSIGDCTNMDDEVAICSAVYEQHIDSSDTMVSTASQPTDQRRVAEPSGQAAPVDGSPNDGARVNVNSHVNVNATRVATTNNTTSVATATATSTSTASSTTSTTTSTTESTSPSNAAGGLSPHVDSDDQLRQLQLKIKASTGGVYTERFARTSSKCRQFVGAAARLMCDAVDAVDAHDVARTQQDRNAASRKATAAIVQIKQCPSKFFTRPVDSPKSNEDKDKADSYRWNSDFVDSESKEEVMLRQGVKQVISALQDGDLKKADKRIVSCLDGKYAKMTRIPDRQLLRRAQGEFGNNKEWSTSVPALPRGRCAEIGSLITLKLVKGVANSLKKGLTGGASGWRNEHIHMLARDDDGCRALTLWIRSLITGSMLQCKAVGWLRDLQSCIVKQPGKKARIVTPEEPLLSLAMRVAKKVCKSDIENMFAGGYQYALGKYGGCEAAVVAIRSMMCRLMDPDNTEELEESVVLLCKDAQAAFTSVDTDTGLRQIRDKVPGLFALMRFVYGVPANVSMSGVRIGCISKGSRQGTVGGPLLYMAATQPCLESAGETYPRVFLSAATDDINIVGVRSEAVACGDAVMGKLEHIGVRNNVSKDQEYCPTESENGGIVVLGQPVGTPEFCEDWLNTEIGSIVAKLQFLHDHVVVHEPAGAFLYVKHSIEGQIRYVSRSVNSVRDAWEEVHAEFERTVLACITACGTYGEIGDDAIRLLYQQPDYGGLGLKAPCPKWAQSLLSSIERLNKRPRFKANKLAFQDGLMWAGNAVWEKFHAEVDQAAEAQLARDGQVAGKTLQQSKEIYLSQARKRWKPNVRKFRRSKKRCPIRAEHGNSAQQRCFQRAAKTPFKHCTQCILQPSRSSSPGHWRQMVKVHMGLEQPVRKQVRALKVWWRRLGLSAKSLKVFDNMSAREGLMRQMSRAQRAIVSIVHADDVCKMSEEVFAESVLANIVQYGK